MWILVVNPPRERPSAWFCAPFSGRGLLMGADDRGVEHQILVVAIGGQRGEHPLPHTCMTPAAETFVHRLPLSVALRQVAPMRTGS